MKTLIALSFVALFSASAFAADPIAGANASTTKAFFDSGGAPIGLPAGDYVGRCFVAEGLNPAVLNTNVPAAAYMDFNTAVANEFGIFAVPKSKQVPVDFFDEGENLASVANDRSAIEENNSLPVREENGSLVESFHINGLDNLAKKDTITNEAYELRQTHGLLTAKIEITAPYVKIERQVLRSGDAVGYCYFFQKVY